MSLLYLLFENNSLSSLAMSRLKLALFGSGRIGAVHFVNMITNQRASISWIVEVDVKRAEELVKKYNMNDMVKVINMEDADKVFSDSRY